MSRIRADKLVNKNASGGPDLPLGATISGVVTATTFLVVLLVLVLILLMLLQPV